MTPNGGWYLNGTTLEYRAYKEGTTELSTTALVKISGLSTSQVVNGTGNDAGYVLVNANGNWRRLNSDNNDDIKFDDKTTDGKTTGTITIASAILPKQANKAITVTGSTNYDYTIKLNTNDQVRLSETDTVTHGTNGTTTITGKLTAGYTIATNGKSATYYVERTNQTLAKITGLAKNYTQSTLALNAAYKENTAGGEGVITLSKLAAGSIDTSALGTTAITLTMDNVAVANGISYQLKLNEGSGTYKQVAANDEAAYWTVSGTKATYQYYSPTGYELTNAQNEVIATDGKVYKADGTAYEDGQGDRVATKIKVTAEKTTIIATVTGLANDITTNITDEKVEKAKTTPTTSIADKVGIGQARFGEDGKDTEGKLIAEASNINPNQFVSGITVTTDVSNAKTGNNKPVYSADGKTTIKGNVAIKITKAVLPTRGNVVVTPGKDFTVEATLGDDFYNSEVKNQRIWVINGNTAVYKEVDLAYYTSTTTDGKTTIKCTVQKDVATLATIKGLNAAWLADESHLTRNTKDTSGVITHIDGINITTAAGYKYDDKGKMTAKSDEVGEITLAKEVLDGMNVTITKSDNFKLALKAGNISAVDGTNDKTTTTTTDVVLPAFNNYKWNLSGTIATLKGDIATAGYTLSDDSKTVTYTAAAKNQTLATVNGLKKGTQLERETEGTTESGNKDYRKIGNYVDTTFTDGLAIVTNPENAGGKLTHKTKTNDKTLNRMPITISRLVMDTSKISLTSNFFTLALNKTDKNNAVSSRTYVLEKSDLYNGDKVKTDLDKTVGWHGSLGSIAILKQALPAYYTTVADSAGTIKTINYTKPGDAKTLATVKGLNSAINENDIAFDTTYKKITIKSVDALTTGNVTITGTEGYTLALDVNKVGEAKLSNETWSQTGTTVNYTALVTSPGYKLNADKNLITYTKEATTTPTTLATITGLRASLAKVDPSTTQDSSGNNGGNTDGGSTDPGDAAETNQTDQTSWQYKGVTFSNETGTITIGKEALNGSNIAIKGSANYKLALATDLDKTTAPDPAKRWVISGTTATYKVVTPEYYTYNASNNTITYTKAVDAVYQSNPAQTLTYAATTETDKYTNGKGKTIPALVSISGLKSGLVVNDNGDKIGYYKADGSFVENAITFGTGTDDKNITINNAGVLNGTTVKIDNTAHTNGYRIKLSSDLVNAVKPKLEGDATWTISRGTATLKGNVAAGYSDSSDGKSIDFSAKKTNTAIATITGLKNTATTTEGLTLGTTEGTDDHIITVDNDLLSTSNVKLTTNIAILGKPYQLALDAYDASTNPTGTKQEDDVTSTEQNRWSIDKTTATYYTWRDTYYSLNNGQDGASDTITYHAAGEGLKTGDDVLATVTGLASGLVTIQDDQIRGITVGQDETKTVEGKEVTTFKKDEDGTIIQLSSNVLPTKVKDEVKVTSVANGKIYNLRLDADDTSIPLPKDAVYYDIATTGVATVKIKRAISAGFDYENASNKTTIKYKAEDLSVGGVIGTISGLDKDKTVINSDGNITGITINQNTTGTDARTITLSLDVLNGPVTFTTTNTTNPYKLKLGNDVTGASSAPAFEKTTTTGKFDLRAGATNGGYTLGEQSTTDGVVTQKITYLEGGNKGNVVASITGLKNIDKDKVAVTEVKDGDEVTGYNITISSADALNAQDVTVTPSDSTSTKTYTLELNGVAASEATDTWDLTNGTATFTHKVTAGYKVDSATGKIVYTPESSIVSTLNNLSKEVTWTVEDGGKTLATGGTKTVTDNTDPNNPTTKTVKTGITFADGVFTVTDEKVLAHKAVKLTTKATGKDSSGKNVTANYTVDLDSDIKAKTDPAVWNKADNATVATLTETTASGYSISGDQQNITYSSDPVVTILATVNGLNKDSVAYTEGNKSYVGIGVTNSSTPPATTTYTKGLEVTTKPSDSTTGTITIGQNVLNNAKVTLTSNKYVLALDDTTSPVVGSNVAEKKVWAISGTTATYKNVKPAYYTLDANSKGLTYTAQKDTNVRETNSPNVTVIKGLKSGLKLNEEGKVINADGTTTDGLTVKNNGAVLLTSAVLGTNKEITSDQYTLELAEGIKTEKEEATEWVGSGTTYTFKKYDKAYFTYETGNKKITYTAPTAGTTYATISNLKSDATINFAATEPNNLAKGGTIKISADQLIDKDVTLKVNSGTFALAFADDFDAGKKSSIGSSTLKWGKTNATTAVLQGTKTAGYTLSEDAKSITYKKTAGTVTLATISGLKSGFELPAETTFDTDSSGNQIITLDKTMLGTANVTLKGDGYKLALAEDAASETDTATWVKATNATKATFTQQTYNGFTESADGKSLTYIKNTSKIDLATINGLSKDLTTDNMKVVYATDSQTAETAKTEATAAISKDGTLVVLDDVNKVIYLKQDALSGKVTLANKDGYTFALVDDNNASVTELGGTKITDAAPKVTFNNGTMSIVAGTDDEWVLSDDKKTLNYTAAKYDTLATVSGLPKTITNTAHDGITVDGTKIKIAKEALVSTDTTTSKDTSLLANNAKIVLTNKKVGNTTYEYAIELGTGLNAKATAPTADKKVWALSGTNLSLKEVTSAYYLTPEASGTTQTITYVAEKVGDEIAKIAGVPANTVSLSSDATAVYVGGDTSKPAFTATMSGDGAMNAKTIEVGSDLRTAIKTADKAVTLSLTGTGYTFDIGFLDETNPSPKPTDGEFDFITSKSFTALKSAGKATVINEKSSGWTEASTDNKLIFAKSADSIVATVNGLRKDFDPSGAAEDSNADDLDFNSSDKLKSVTVGNTALNKTNVTLTIPSKGEVYNLALASNVASSLRSLSDTPAASDVANWTDDWMNQTDWVVSGGTASYKTYNKGNYYIKPAANANTTPNSIAYNAPTAGTTYAKISGLSKTAESVASSVDLSNYSSTAAAGKDIIITLGAKELSTSKVTLAVSKANSVKAANTNNDTLKSIFESIASDLNDKILVGNKVAPNFKLALDTTTADSVKASSIDNAVWDNNGTVANLTGTITKGYKLSNDQKSITYQAADSKLQVIAKVSGIKKDSQISDSLVAAITDTTDPNYNAALPNLQYITLNKEHLGTSNVMLTGEGYKLKLGTDVVLDTNSISGAENGWHDQTEWVANNGTFTYKTYDKANYKVNDTGMQVIYTGAKDDTKNNANHKTFVKITGLSKTAEASDLAAAGATVASTADNVTTIDVTTANGGVISLGADVLTTGNVALTDNTISASLNGAPVLYNGGYTLALKDNVAKSTASNVNATVSGTKATWAGTQGAGYLLANDEQNVTYYSAKKDKQTIATVTGLNASVTAENSNDSLSSSYNEGTNVMTLTKDKLSSNVGISGTAAYNFSDFENGTITGSGSADKVSIGGASVSINAGNGNDIINFTNSSRTAGNTFIYANGNGNDVIYGFTSKDVIKVTNVVGTTSTTNEVTDSTGTKTEVTTYKNNIEVYADTKISGDTLVKVNNNVIRLKDYKSNVTVYDSKGNHWDANENNGGQTNNGSFVADTTPQTQGNVLADDDYAMTPQNLFADDNYAMTPNLSSIVKSSTSSYMADDLVADDATALTKQSTAVSYSDKK